MCERKDAYLEDSRGKEKMGVMTAESLSRVHPNTSVGRFFAKTLVPVFIKGLNFLFSRKTWVFFSRCYLEGKGGSKIALLSPTHPQFSYNKRDGSSFWLLFFLLPFFLPF